MNNELLITLIASGVWLTCGFISYGFAAAQSYALWNLASHKQYLDGDLKVNTWMSLFGPINLLAVLAVLHGRHGWRV